MGASEEAAAAEAAEADAGAALNGLLMDEECTDERGNMRSILRCAVSAVAGDAAAGSVVDAAAAAAEAAAAAAGLPPTPALASSSSKNSLLAGSVPRCSACTSHSVCRTIHSRRKRGRASPPPPSRDTDGDRLRVGEAAGDVRLARLPAAVEAAALALLRESITTPGTASRGCAAAASAARVRARVSSARCT